VKIHLPQPKEKKGIKYIDCPFYGDCLTHAVRSYWKTWNCDQCQNLRLKAVRQKMRFVASYYQLMAEIYPEFKKRYGPAMSIFDVEV